MKTRHHPLVQFLTCAALCAGIILLTAPFRLACAEPAGRNKETGLVRTVVGNDLDGIHHSEVSLKSIQAAWDLWYENLARKNGLHAGQKFYADLPSLIKDFTEGKLDLINTTSLNYLRMKPLIRDHMAPEIYGVIRNEKRTHRYLLLVRRNSGIDSLEKLENTTLLMKQDENTGRLFINTLLLKRNLPEIKIFFGHIQKTETLSRAVLSLFFQKGEACITTESVFNTMMDLNPQIGEQLTILQTSPEIVNSVFFFHKDYDPQAKAVLLHTALNLENSEYGRLILKLYEIDRLIQLQESDLEPTIMLLRRNIPIPGNKSSTNTAPLSRRRLRETTNP